MLDLNIESHEVQPQYQDHANIDPIHLNMKHVTNNHHQKVVGEWLYLLVLRMVVGKTIDILQTEHCAQ